MKLQGLTLGRGILRAYLVLWLLWALFLAFSNHKALLTAVGVTYWTPESAMERDRLEFEELGCNDPIKTKKEECSSLLPPGFVFMNDVMTEKEVDLAVTDFFLGTLVLPMVGLLLGVLLWFLTKWVVQGFVNKDRR